MRGVGYSLETAIADLIDNSITAGARNVWIDFRWLGRASSMLLLDDGLGMSEQKLVDAMRPGTEGPLGERSERDLGRFGLGLKTASLSQCRRFTVATKRGGDAAEVVRSWDLDFVSAIDEWRLRLDISEAAAHAFKALSHQQQGTAVFWEALDRVVGTEDPTNPLAEEHFLRRLDSVKRHLSMTFHRYLEGAGSSLRIFVNGTEDRHRVHPWDPFLTRHPATESTPIERLFHDGHRMTLQGFVLPHRDQLTEREYEDAGGPSGWSSQQGFYVYRNQRLLVAGGWLGLGETRAWTQEEHFKLARLSIEFPNNLDAAWHIDIKKSHASPPRSIRARVVELAKSVRDTSRRVYSHRGRLPTRGASAKVAVRPWEVREGTRNPKYVISRSHPLVAKALAIPGAEEDVEALLRLTELTVPIQRIWLDSLESGDKPVAETDLPPLEDVVALAQTLSKSLCSAYGMDAEAARRAVLGQWPFSEYPPLRSLLEGRDGATAGA
jgi:hypothetical protein